MGEVDSTNAMREIITEVMSIEDITLGGPQATLRARGKLSVPSRQAFELLRSRLAELGHTPIMYRQEGEDYILVTDSQMMVPTPPLRWLSVVLFVLTLARVAQLGIRQDAAVPLETTLDYFRNWTAALPFTGAILGVLLARELARYLVARRHGLHVGPPYFVPLPGLTAILVSVLTALFGRTGVALAVGIARRSLMPWGTLGSIAGLRAPARDRRAVFDMAVATTLSGLLVSLAVLVVGLRQSEVIRIDFSQAFLLEGQSLGYRLIKLAMFGKWLPGGGEDVLISTLALAGWAGLFLTMLYLLPFGSLDGGHILYGLVGQRAVWGRWLVGVVLALLSVFYFGWLLWLAIIFLLMRDNAQVLDEITTLGTGRALLGIAMFVVLVLLFVPVPFRVVAPFVSGPGA